MESSSQDSTKTATQGTYISNPFDLFRPSWEAFKLCWVQLLIPVAVIIALALVLGTLAAAWGIISARSGGEGNLTGMVLLVLLAFVAVSVFIAPAITRILLASARGQKLSFMKAVGPWKTGLTLLGTGILTALAVVGGLLLLIIPGLIFLAWFSLASYIVVEENLGAIESMKRSKELVQGRVVEMLGLAGMGNALLVLSIVPVLGSIAAFLGSFVYSPAPAIRYLQLKNAKATGQQLPKTHGANWLVLVLALIGIGISSQNDKKQREMQNNDNLPGYEQSVEL